MDERTALHAAARRYCLERIERGEAWQRSIRQNSLPPEGEEAIYRAIVYWFILPELERVVPHDFATVEALRSFVLTTAQTVQIPQPSDGPDEAHECTIAEERDAFCDYMRSLSVHDASALPPLPYRRLLSEREAERLWRRLERRWGVRPAPYWYPLNGQDPPANVLAFNDAWLLKYVPPTAIRDILAGRRIRRVWQLASGGWGPQYDMDLTWFLASYLGNEVYYTSDKMDWLLYRSHEYSLTVGGDWLISAIQRMWPEWHDHLYTNWDYQHPPRI